MTRWLLRRGKHGSIHSAVQEGGGKMVIMMTVCGLHVRWDLPHEPWQRAPWDQTLGSLASHITCKRCKA